MRIEVHEAHAIIHAVPIRTKRLGDMHTKPCASRVRNCGVMNKAVENWFRLKVVCQKRGNDRRQVAGLHVANELGDEGNILDSLIFSLKCTQRALHLRFGGLQGRAGVVLSSNKDMRDFKAKLLSSFRDDKIGVLTIVT